MTEQWKECLEGFYEVSDLGRVRRAKPGTGTRVGKILKPSRTDNDYERIRPGVRGKATTLKVHCLVAEAFLGPRPSGYDINHKDGNKTNNHSANLEYVTRGDNVRHAVRNGLRKPHRKFSQAVIDRVRQLHKEDYSLGCISSVTGVSYPMCWQIVNGRTRTRRW